MRQDRAKKRKLYIYLFIKIIDAQLVAMTSSFEYTIQSPAYDIIHVYCTFHK